MKATTLISSIGLGCALLLGLSACKKQASTQPQTLEEGLTLMRAALVKASPSVQSNLYNGVDGGIRYGDHTQAAAALDAIASDPSLDAQQKKLVNNVIELLKAQSQNPPAAAKPAS